MARLHDTFKKMQQTPKQQTPKNKVSQVHTSTPGDGARGSFLRILAASTLLVIGIELPIPQEARGLEMTLSASKASLAQIQQRQSASLKQEQFAETPPIPPLPDNIPDVVDPDTTGILGLSPEPEDNIGVGYLHPEDLSFLEEEDEGTSPLRNANWLRGIALPIYGSPNGEHWGWLINGWLITTGYDPIAIGRDAAFSMLQTHRELFSFPVIEIREDGWFRFQYTPAGTAWAHLSHLDIGPVAMAVDSWEDRFEEVGFVEFLSHGASQPLYTEANADSEIVNPISPSSFIEVLDFDGDWMRVRVTQPASACNPLPGANTEEGWIRWRNADGKSSVWYPPKGC